MNSDKNGAEAVRITFTSSLGNSDKQINLRLISAQLHDGQVSYRRAARILLRGESLNSQVNSFCLKNVSFGQRAEQIRVIHAYHRRGVPL